MPRRIYWDSCAFIGLLNQEPGKVNYCSAVWTEAENGKTVIYTSFWAFAEVYKAKCEGGLSKPLEDAQDEQITKFLRPSWVKPVVVDELISMAARRLLRTHSECKKPTDAIHLATACALSVEEMHTFDGSDLLRLDQKVLRADGRPLTICKVRPIPPSVPVSGSTDDWIGQP